MEKLDLATSVLFHTGSPDRWNLDFHARHRVGRISYWTDRLPFGWREYCNAMDYVWLPSEAIAMSSVTLACTPKNLALYMNSSIAIFSALSDAAVPLPHRRKFNFLSAIPPHRSSSAWPLLQAFLLEFGACEDVSLTLQVPAAYHLQGDPAADTAFFIEKELGLFLQDCPAVILLDSPTAPLDRAQLYAAADAFVFLGQGECYLRPLLEAAASGVPIVATHWGGVLDLLEDTSSFLIPVESMAPVLIEEQRAAGHLWPQPSPADLQATLRCIQSNPAAARERAQNARGRVTKCWSAEAVLPQWRDAFRRLLE